MTGQDECKDDRAVGEESGVMGECIISRREDFIGEV